MKKTFLFLFCFLLSVGICFAEDITTGLTPTQKNAFLSQALSIQTSQLSESEGLGSSYNITPYSSLGVTSVSTKTVLDWQAYQGPNQITKADFFSIVGDFASAEKCRIVEERVAQKHKLGTTLTIAGGAGCIAGFCAMMAPYFDDYSDTSMIVMYTGAAVAILSAIPLGIGINNMMYKENVNISVDFALGMAQNYNTQLATRIKVEM